MIFMSCYQKPSKVKPTNNINILFRRLLICCSLILFSQCSGNRELLIENNEEIIIRISQEIEFVLIKDGFRYSFQKTDGTILVPAHPGSGLLAGSHENLSLADSTKYLHSIIFLEIQRLFIPIFLKPGMILVFL